MAEFKPASSAMATVTTVASSATSVALIAANLQRKSLIITNPSTAILYILLGDAVGTAATATTNHSVQVPSLGTYTIDNFTGPASGIWAAANGSANITQLT